MPNSHTPKSKATSFSAKEKDEETQYSYFGARYYMSDISVWLSVDPLSDKYPTMSAYMYCAGNPVMLVDPDGRNFDEFTVNLTTGEMTKISDLGGEEVNFFHITESNSNGGETHIKTYVFEQNANGLTNLEGNQYGIRTHGQSGIYLSEKALGALLGVINETGFNDLSIGNFSLPDGTSPSPSTSHKNGNNGDLRPLRTDNSGNRVTVDDPNFDFKRNSQLVDALNKFGWNDVLSETDKQGKLVPGTRHFSGYYDKNGIWKNSRHNDHFHIQGFKPRYKVSNNLINW